jgi:transposase
MFMIVLSDGFKKFESAKQFTCYIGMSPVEKRSGSSVRGRSGISKHGNPKLKNLLFMCSFTALKPKKPQKSGLRKKWVIKQELKLENGRQLTLKSNLLIQNESHSNPIA